MVIYGYILYIYICVCFQIYIWPKAFKSPTRKMLFEPLPVTCGDSWDAGRGSHDSSNIQTGRTRTRASCQVCQLHLPGHVGNNMYIGRFQSITCKM